MKKGRHRRFEEARKLKQSGPSAFDLGIGSTDTRQRTADDDDESDDDQYAALAEKYGYVDDDDVDDELED
jgi:hypothetical protein